MGKTEYPQLYHFILPRLLHSHELLDIRKSDIDTLERYQRKFLNQIQTLPERTATVAVLTLLGAKTIEANIDTRIITTFLNITKDPSTVEFQIAIRQFTIKTESNNSCSSRSNIYFINMTSHVPNSCWKNIRSIKQVEYWKIKCKHGIAEFWKKNTKRKIREKSTLKYLQLQENKDTTWSIIMPSWGISRSCQEEQLVQVWWMHVAPIHRSQTLLWYNQCNGGNDQFVTAGTISSYGILLI